MVEVLDDKTVQEWAEQYKKYPSVTPDGFEAFHAARVAPISYEIPLGSRVLDVGCNDGEFMKLLIEKRDCHVDGVDVSEVAIAKAREKVGENFVHLLKEGDSLPFQSETFDYVTLNEVLVHLVDPAAVLKEIRRVLKPNGVLLGSTPHANLERFLWDDKRMHHRYFDEQGLRDILEPLFPFVYVRTLNGAQFAVSLATSFLADKPAEMLFKAGGTETQDWEAELMSDDKLRVWFGYTQLAGTAYYRMLGFAEQMEKQGVAQPAWERATWDQIDERGRWWQSNIRNKIVLNQLENILRVAHVSVWQVTASRHVLAFLRCAKDLANERWYKGTGEKKAFVTEIDDNLFDIPAYNIASNPYQPNSDAEWVALKQIELSDALICSTQFLVEKMQAMFPGKRVFLMPNCIDFDLWDNAAPDAPISPKGEGRIRIGYTGCSNHRGDLELIKEPLCAILKEFPNVELIMTPQPEPEGGMFMGWPGVDNIGIVGKWATIDKYPSFVKGWEMDIGIAPLCDNDFNRAKSNLRWIEYAALRLPCVASRVYPFKNSIRHGEDGFIANSNREWYETIKNLILDAGRRKEIGMTAYERVKHDFNMALTARKYADILTSIRDDTNRT